VTTAHPLQLLSYIEDPQLIRRDIAAKLQLKPLAPAPRPQVDSTAPIPGAAFTDTEPVLRAAAALGARLQQGDAAKPLPFANLSDAELMAHAEQVRDGRNTLDARLARTTAVDARRPLLHDATALDSYLQAARDESTARFHRGLANVIGVDADRLPGTLRSWLGVDVQTLHAGSGPLVADSLQPLYDLATTTLIDRMTRLSGTSQATVLESLRARRFDPALANLTDLYRYGKSDTATAAFMVPERDIANHEHMHRANSANDVTLTRAEIAGDEIISRWRMHEPMPQGLFDALPASVMAAWARWVREVVATQHPQRSGQHLTPVFRRGRGEVDSGYAARSDQRLHAMETFAAAAEARLAAPRSSPADIDRRAAFAQLTREAQRLIDAPTVEGAQAHLQEHQIDGTSAPLLLRAYASSPQFLKLQTWRVQSRVKDEFSSALEKQLGLSAGDVMSFLQQNGFSIGNATTAELRRYAADAAKFAQGLESGGPGSPRNAAPGMSREDFIAFIRETFPKLIDDNAARRHINMVLDINLYGTPQKLLEEKQKLIQKLNNRKLS